jgi:pimeloyl-ACP methyl ester carboxylesterase
MSAHEDRRPALVLIHGGKYDSRCWRPTIDSIIQRAPSQRIVAINYPGRQGIPGDLSTLSIGRCVESLVAQIDESGVDKVVLVGHSLAGIMLPGVAATLRAERVRRIVFLACNIPPQGHSVLETLIPPVRFFATKTNDHLPLAMSRWMFCGGMTTEQRAFSQSHLVRESLAIIREPVDHSVLPRSIPRTWIRTLRDRVLPVKQQCEFMHNIGGVDEVVDLNTCHNAMISMPDELAMVLLDRTYPGSALRRSPSRSSWDTT